MGGMELPADHAVLFDLDGVLTPTARIHMLAWERLFTEVLLAHGDQSGYGDEDYFAHVDGKPRYDGVRDMLASRGIDVPQGDPSDPPQAETVCGYGNRKNALFTEILHREGIDPYPGSAHLVADLRAAGTPIAVVSSSRNARDVLEAAGMAPDFPVVVDGLVATREGLAGKPAPDTFLHAAVLLGRPADRCVVVEDAVSGVAAGRAGNFGLVVGVDRGTRSERLREAGADVVVNDLEELRR